MNIQFVSDLHLDVSKGFEMPGGDVLIIAGDACEARELVKEHHSTKVINYKTLSAWCLDKSEWRSFRVDNVTHIKVLE